MYETDNLKDLDNFFRLLQGSSCEVVYIVSDVVKLGVVKRSRNPRNEVARIAELIFGRLSGKTVVFPTATLSFCERDDVFDARSTPSEQMGVLNEVLRKDFATYRSCHPLWSHGGWGPLVQKLFENASKNAYGADSVWDRLRQFSVLVVNLGVDIKSSMTLVHHMEQIHGVPYRFSKPFHLKVVDFAGHASEDVFTLNVIYRNLNVERDLNIKLCADFVPYLLQNKFKDLQSYDYGTFYEHLRLKFSKDIFCWVRNANDVKQQCLEMDQ